MMFKQLQRILLLSVLLAGSVSLTGCIALFIGAAAGAGTIAYVKGSLEYNVDKPLTKVHDASLAGLKKLKLFISSDEMNVHDSTIKAEFDDKTEVKVILTALTEVSTQIRIRIGVFGDEDKSQMVLDAIKKKL